MTNDKEKKERKSRILLLAASTTVAALQEMGFRCAVHGQMAVHALGGGKWSKATIPSLWNVMIFVDTNMDFTLLRERIVATDPYCYSCGDDDILMYRYVEDDTIYSKRKSVCKIFLSNSLMHFTFTHVPDLIGCHLPIVPYPYLIYELLIRWMEVRHLGSKAHRFAANLERLTVFLRRSPRSMGSTHGHFTEEGHREMSEMVRLFTQYHPHRQQAFVELGLLDASVLDEPQPVSTGPKDSPADLGPAALLPSATARVLEAARVTICILHSLGCSTAIFGGLACFLYGTTRAPKDADILVIPSRTARYAPDTETFKRALVNIDPAHFFTRESRHPGATYRVLHYRSDAGDWTCKVDILVPGILHLPALALEYIVWIDELPVIPFALLLLQKLQAYHDHRYAAERHQYVRWEKDKADIEELLGLEELVDAVIRERPWYNLSIFSEEFMALSRQRVREFASYFGYHATWQDMGFSVY